jgi:hypothetical protein
MHDNTHHALVYVLCAAVCAIFCTLYAYAYLDSTQYSVQSSLFGCFAAVVACYTARRPESMQVQCASPVCKSSVQVQCASPVCKSSVQVKCASPVCIVQCADALISVSCCALQGTYNAMGVSIAQKAASLKLAHCGMMHAKHLRRRHPHHHSITASRRSRPRSATCMVSGHCVILAAAVGASTDTRSPRRAQVHRRPVHRQAYSTSISKATSV